ncbi:MAG: hypothetical protein JXB04_11720 [Kiritimatiellae bacterium]|nr:hypothetical protein [Kiritimatiellia bacterium]
MCAALFAAAAVRAADTFHLHGKPPVVGSFDRYEDGIFTVKGEDGKTYRIGEDRLQKFALAAPAKVTVTFKGKQDAPVVWLLAYEPPYVVCEKEGTKGRYSLRDVKSLKAPENLSWSEGYKQEGEVISKGESVYLTSFLSTGVINIVHFHNRSSADSNKLEAYLSRVQRLSGGEVKYLIALVPRPGCEVAEQHGVTGVPEVWVYDGARTLVRKLNGTIDARIVDGAIEHARSRIDATQ